MGFISSSIQLVCVLWLESWDDSHLEFLLKVVCRLRFWCFFDGFCLVVVCFSLNYSFVCFLFVVSWLCLFLPSAQSIDSCILFSTLFLGYECLRMFGSYKNFLSPSTIIDTFVEYGNLSRQTQSFRIWTVFLQGLLDFRFGYIMMGFPCKWLVIFCSYTIQNFSLFLYILYFDHDMLWIELFYWSYLFGVLCVSPVWVCLSLIWGSFLLWSY